jgi:hypothetical protein
MSRIKPSARQFHLVVEIPVAAGFGESLHQLESDKPVAAPLVAELLPADKLVQGKSAGQTVVTLDVVARNLGEYTAVVLHLDAMLEPATA